MGLYTSPLPTSIRLQLLNILPGKYEITASHPVWTISKVYKNALFVLFLTLKLYL